MIERGYTMTTMQLNCFLAVAETLNFAKAASQLNVTQPAVTQQIHSLENELNVKLFKRTTRTVELTPEGYVFLNDAKNVLHIVDHAKKRFEEADRRERMVFSIGCHSYDELDLLPDILGKMLEQCPTLYPIFQVVPFQHLYQLLKEDTVDVVLAFWEKTTKKSYGIYKELAKVNAVAILSQSLPLSQKASLSLSDLLAKKIIVFNPQIAPDCFNTIQQKIMQDKPMAEISMCDSAEECITLAKAGFGIAVLPDLMTLKDPSLSYIPLTGFEPMSYGAYYNSTANRLALKLFLKLCREYFPSFEDGQE